MKNLFEAIARHRPEWLAQGLLMRAITTEPSVRVLLLERLGWSISPNEVPELTEEEVTMGGWRADVLVAWGQQKARLELKLLAGFTLRQEEALLRRDVALVILPQKEGRKLPVGIPVITWAELANQVQTDSVLKNLLANVSDSSTWALEDITGSELLQDFDNFVSNRNSGSWHHMYRFLSTIHFHLLEMAPTKYRASDGWARAWRAAEPYYGFCFWLGNKDIPRFWLGFWRRKESGSLVFSTTVPSTRNQSVLFMESDRFSAETLAQRVLEEANAYKQRQG
ncbi:hypothetical protein F0U59_39980 [Archangium gephyra]|nr:hypothetical protein F0U59_39980 [Archangium gephyra]